MGRPLATGRLRSARSAGALVACLATAGLAVAAGSSYAHTEEGAHVPFDLSGVTTLDHTVKAGDPKTGFKFLRLGGGEERIVREALGKAKPGRAGRRRSLLYLGQITDFQLSDEESPARVEFVDRNPASSDFKSAHRPQESLVAHQVELTIRQMNRFLESEVRQGNGRYARLANAVMTGDLADNQHRNETEWVMQLLEGGTIDPNSGSTNPADYEDEPSCAGLPKEPLIAEALNYTGVQDYDDYPAGVPDTDFYDPDDPRGEYSAKDFPTYQRLLDEAQKPFTARGLKVPSYVAFGNHDGLAQGNEDAIQPYETVATGCLKPFPPGDPVTSLPGPGGDGSVLDELLDPGGLSHAAAVPPDEDRQYVDKRQFKKIFAEGESDDDHGFAYVDRKELEDSAGAASYYTFVPDAGARRVRYIVLDTLSEGGVVGMSSRGNIDDPQWQWLKGELRKAERREEIVMVFAHHATDSLDADVPDELAAECTVDDEHDHDVNPGCDRDPRTSTPLHFGDDLERLLHRFPNAVALVAGHSHENEIEPIRDGEGGGYWEIKAPAIVDWPPQHRLIEVMDNRDRTLSLFVTLLDHDGPSRAPDGGPTPSAAAAGSSAAGAVEASEAVEDFSLAELASVGRTIGYNDPQEGPDGSEGRARDHNVELLLRDPRLDDQGGGGGDDPGGGGSGGGGSGGGGSGGGSSGGGGGSGGGTGSAGAPGGDDPDCPDFDSRADAQTVLEMDPTDPFGLDADGDGEACEASFAAGAAASVGSDEPGRLPFTGLGLAFLALAASGLLAGGVAVRRRTAG